MEEKIRKMEEHNTFEISSLDSTVVEAKLFHEPQKDDEDDGPLVFFCGKCRLPVGDSSSWDGSEDSENQIRLKRVTNNVLIGKETRMIEASKKRLCLVVDLACRGCHTLLGVIYSSTPKSMDHKRFVFCLNVADIDSYVLGSAKQMLTAEGSKEQPVTLEYRMTVEEQLTKMKMLVLSMAQRLQEIETGLQDECEEP
ncbi:protein Mis18-alpha [Thalassophryne amazonica]|uniref:protein Mis18-alpha n=1 Tax=Thalassophryne amazonica TaxID=390379 RepID=UPI0014717931|nr:protein Mis18-alpha [Thalassophryne amazonica]